VSLEPLVVILFSIVLIGAALAYAVWSRSRTSAPVNVAGDQPAAGDSTRTLDAATLARLQNGPYVLFRNTKLGTAHGRVFVSAAREGVADRYPTPLVCERVDFRAWRLSGGGAWARDQLSRGHLRAALRELHQMPLPGIPPPVSLSSSGRFAEVTVFVSGDSYAAGNFSTRAIMIETATGGALGDLEQWTVTRDGQPFKAVDFNFSGITFADDRGLYATLQAGGRRYLIEGDLPARIARVMDDDIACASLSPDGTRITFKKRETIGGRLVWRVAVQHLAKRMVTVLSEPAASTTSRDGSTIPVCCTLFPMTRARAVPQCGRPKPTGLAR
jgi:hypothetical protein